MIAPDPKYPAPGARIMLCARHILRAGRWRHGDLSAPYWRIYWNAGPGAYVTVNDHEIHLLSSRIYVLPPDTSYSTRNTRDVDHFYLHFVKQSPPQSVVPELYDFSANKIANNAIAGISTVLRRPKPALIGLETPAYLLIYLALDCIPADKFSSPCSDARISNIITCMEAHPEHDIHNDEWARRTGMNTNAFIRLFKTQTGVTPQDYQRQKRLEKACLLLRFTRQTIEEIAGATGFCERYHFTRVFRRKYGMGPAAFRKTPSF